MLQRLPQTRRPKRQPATDLPLGRFIIAARWKGYSHSRRGTRCRCPLPERDDQERSQVARHFKLEGCTWWSPPAASDVCTDPPGSPARMAAYSARYARGEQIFSPRDYLHQPMDPGLAPRPYRKPRPAALHEVQPKTKCSVLFTVQVMNTTGPIVSQIRKALDLDPRPAKAIAEETKISESVLCRFRQGSVDLPASRIDRLADALDLVLMKREIRE